MANWKSVSSDQSLSIKYTNPSAQLKSCVLQFIIDYEHI